MEMTQYEFDLAMVKEDGVYIMNIQKQSYEMCIEAVRNNKEAILYIRWDELNLTKEQKNNIYLEAVRNDGLSLEYIEEQTEEICIEAIRQANQAILFVKNMTKNIYLESIA